MKKAREICPQAFLQPLNKYHAAGTSDLLELLTVGIILLLPIVSFALGTSEASWAKVARLRARYGLSIHRPAASISSDRAVLIVTRDSAYQWGVRATAEPRGYSVQICDTASEGRARLLAARGRIQIVVVDQRSSGSSDLVRSIKRSWPAIHVIVLEGPGQSTRLAQSLLAAL